MAELLWAIEEAIACRAVACVVADIGTHSKLLDFTASRRLSLRAAATGGSIFLLRYGVGREASAAHLRWRLSPAQSGQRRYDAKAPGPPRWQLELERGTLIKQQTAWLLGWTEHGLETFELERQSGDGRIRNPAFPGPVPAQLAHRLPQTA
jgi:protein ImuA